VVDERTNSMNNREELEKVRKETGVKLKELSL